MKKTHKFLSIFAVSLVAVFALSCCFFAACGKNKEKEDTGSAHTHTYSGDYYSDETGHWQVCAEDGEKGPVTAHTYGDVVVSEAADCVNAGKGTQTCAVCGYTEDVTIDALGHDYVLDVAAEGYVPATCTTDGTGVYVCSRGDDSYTETIPATGHSYVVTFGEWNDDGNDG